MLSALFALYSNLTRWKSTECHDHNALQRLICAEQQFYKAGSIEQNQSTTVRNAIASSCWIARSLVKVSVTEVTEGSSKLLVPFPAQELILRIHDTFM